MLKKLLIIGVFVGLIYSNAKADEGMWLLPKIKELNIDTMHCLGFKLSAEDIYSVTNPSLKDAIIIFGNGCTGEIVSEKGLIFTNHHCGYDAIQSLSSVDHNYLKDGFWATDNKTELSCNDLTVRFLKRFENVTDSVLSDLPDTLNEIDRNFKISKIEEAIEKDAKDSGRFEAEVRPFFGGNEYYLIVYEVFKDVRLVGTPPESIGKFGGDTDNWMWPRHTGDFSVFRVYADSLGKPAKYNKANVPLKPKKFLPVSLKGISQGDFTMTLGYPGTTKRFYTTSEVEETTDVINKTRIKFRGAKQVIQLKDMNADPKVRIQYASKYARSSNYWKYSIGQNKGLNRLHVIDRKQEMEKNFIKWTELDSLRKAKYGNSIQNISDAIKIRRPYLIASQIYNEGLFRGVEIFNYAFQMVQLYEELSLPNPDTSKVNKYVKELRNYSTNFFRNYNQNTDKKLALTMLEMLSKTLDEEYKFDYLTELENTFTDNYQKYVNIIYKRAFFLNSKKLEKFLENPRAKKLYNDPTFMFTYNAVQKYREFNAKYNIQKNLLQKGQRLFISGLREMSPGKKFYPDANFSMRMSYGKVQSYNPYDATHFDFSTTLKGVIEKEDTSIFEFKVPEKLKQLYNSKNYGPYSKGNDMPVCFLSTNDITGGNSGSPVLNTNGELIGIAFDGNWEAMSGDLIYEPELQRTISIDIRYVLFIIDKFANAQYLLNELNIKN